jgi:hypothetical protein
MPSAKDGSALRLSDREVGAHFCSVERALIFDPAFRNVGWAHFLSSDTLVLRRSKFTDIDRGIAYVLPPDLSKRVNEGDLVSIEGKVDKKVVKDPQGKGMTAFISREYVLAQDVFEARLPAIPPEIPRDEFLDKASSEWRYADQDMLDIVIALQLVSAPPSVYGRGGIGSEGLESFRERGWGSPVDVASTIQGHLPIEFRTGSRFYRYEPLDTVASIRSFRRLKALEANFSLLTPHRVTETWVKERLPIQLPFVLKDSKWTGNRTEMDLDVMDYQLCALYSPMPRAEDILPLALESVKRAHTSEMFDLPAIVEVDPLSGARIALSLMRLNIGREFKGGKYMRRPVTGPEEGMKLLEELLRRGLETVRRRAQDEDYLARDRTMPFRSKLTQADKELYSLLRRIKQDEGIEDIPLDRILPAKGKGAIEASIGNLNRYGYVLLMKGGTMLRPVDLDTL